MSRSVRTRKLLVGDNLEAMARLPDGAVNLIYMDPPFCSGREFDAILPASGRSGRQSFRQAFSDRWMWDEAASGALRSAREMLPAHVAQLLESMVASVPRQDVAAYLLAMGPRLFQVRRILAETGSLYLHCDPMASHYLKVLLDAIFGRENFRSEIVWRRTHAHSSSNRYGPVHDVILFYSRGSGYTWNASFTEYSQEYVEKFYTGHDEQGRFQLITCSAPGDRSGTRAHYSWRGQLPPVGRHWAWKKEQMHRFEADGRLVHSVNGIPRLKRYLHEGSGVALQDVWGDINRLDAHSNERVGFETQKPVALLNRIVAASSNPGDIVLDPFCGSGTTLVAAEQLGRGWIGLDVSTHAVAISLGRIRQEVGRQAVQLDGLPTSEVEALALRENDPLAFGAWGLSMVGTIPRYQDIDVGIVAGTGVLKPRSRSLRVASWVPIRKDFEKRPLAATDQVTGEVGFVVRADRAVRTLVDWISKQTRIDTIREVRVEELVRPEAHRKGYAASVWP